MLQSDSLNRRSRLSVATNNPNQNQFLIQPNTGFDGVVGIATADLINCTGSLLYTGRHILTVAHCFNQENGVANLNPNPNNYTIFFDVVSGRVAIPVKQVFVHPNWTADFDSNYDIAIVELAENAPMTADRYSIYTGQSEVGQVFEKVGYGVGGTGELGENESNFDSIKRQGKNRYDTFSQVFNENPQSNIIPYTQLAYDFDSGLPENDAFGIEYNIPDLGLGIEEIGISSGDSGSPAFIQGEIAGLSSFGQSPMRSGVDVTQSNDTSFGEFFSDTRVSVYAEWIEATIALSNQGNDLIEGTLLADKLNGNQGDDQINGFAGNDTLFGGKNDDSIEGGKGDDLLLGNLGNDLINAGNGNDQAYGGQGNDQLIGGIGNDTLSGDEGQDYLTGNEGSDLFILSNASAVSDINLADKILDFTSIDLIGITPKLAIDNISLELGNVEGKNGVVVINNLSNQILGFVSQVSLEQVQSNLLFL
ncbi:MAG: trypsin-like serine protease [Microcoleaceae cyanobacterium]